MSNPKHRKEITMNHELRDVQTSNTIKGLLTRRACIAVAVVSALLITGCATAPKQATPGMLYHVGLVWLREPGDSEHRQKIISAAHSFAREIPEVQFLSVGQSPPSTSPYVDATFDICFVMRFEDRAALDRYARHPLHERAAKDVFLPLSKKILFCDFISE
jgi:hypothetical protein